MQEAYEATTGDSLPGTPHNPSKPLASASKPLASDDTGFDQLDLDLYVLKLAAKKCWSNYRAWKSHYDNKKGDEETNKRGMDLWKHRALMIEARVEQLQQRA